MACRLKRDESVCAGIGRIVREQIDRALADLLEQPRGFDEAVHDARKRFKKIRAALRLARYGIWKDVYRRENTCFRDAGRALSPARNAQVLLDTLDALRPRCGDLLSDLEFTVVRSGIQEVRPPAARAVPEDNRPISDVVSVLQNARSRVDAWPQFPGGFETVRDGLGRVYKQGRALLAVCRTDPGPERFHEWRKQVKYLLYQARILRGVWKGPMIALEKEISRLADLLGDDHDLEELRTALADRGAELNGRSLKIVTDAIAGRSRTLREEAMPLGMRIFAEKPSRFVSRIESCWNAWRSVRPIRRRRGRRSGGRP